MANLAAQTVLGSIQKKSYYFEEASRKMEYALYVPSAYRKDTKSPLVVLLHGLFDNPHKVIRFRGLIPEAEKRGYIVVAPFGYNDRGWYGSLGNREGMKPANLGDLSEQDVLNVLCRVRQDFNVDGNRIYCMGHSMGGAGSLYLGAKYPDLWAALAPMSPALPFPTFSQMLEQMRHVPVIFVTGDKDKITPVKPAREFVAGMKDMGMDFHYTELQGAGHLALAFRPDVMVEIFEFFDSRARSMGEDAPMIANRRHLPAGSNLPQESSRRTWLQLALWYGTKAAHRCELLAWSVFYFAKSLPEVLFSSRAAINGYDSLRR
jgi:predicted esterase